MTLSQALLDTDILSALIRKHPKALIHGQAYMATHGHFTFSVITRYEVLRGFKAIGATAKLAEFERICAAHEILPLSDDVVIRAAEIYADLYQRGELIGDADILIAASALEHGFGVITNNEDHFKRVTGLHVENWLK